MLKRALYLGCFIALTPYCVLGAGQGFEMVESPVENSGTPRAYFASEVSGAQLSALREGSGTAAPAEPSSQVFSESRNGAASEAAAAESLQGAGTPASEASVTAPAGSVEAMGAVAVSGGQGVINVTVSPATGQTVTDATVSAEPQGAVAAAPETEPSTVSEPLNLELPLDSALGEALANVIARRTLGAALEVTPALIARTLVSIEPETVTSEGVQGDIMTEDTVTVTDHYVAVFDLNRVDESIRDQGLAVFNGLENPLLTWMVSYGEERSELVSGENVTPFAAALMREAQGLNYRLMLPLLDLEDIQRVNVNTVLTHQDAALAAASARYGSDFYLTMAVLDRDGMGSVKWNVYTKDGQRLSGSEIAGLTEELAALTAGDLARTLASLSTKVQEGEKVTPRASALDVFALGPGDGFVRVRIDNVGNLKDVNAMRRTLIIYGYDARVSVVGADGEGLIVEIPTSSDPAILDGTMARARDFTKLGAWHYAYNHATTLTGASVTVGPSDPRRPDSRITVDLRTPEAGAGAGTGVTPLPPAVSPESQGGGERTSAPVVSRPQFSVTGA